jgi:hypothetical protein
VKEYVPAAVGVPVNSNDSVLLDGVSVMPLGKFPETRAHS